jgi:hypothetical protein
MAQVTAPTPQQLNAQRWEQWERDWKERDRRHEEEKRRQQEALRAADKARQEATEREIAKLKKVADFKRGELFISNIFDDAGLTPAERGRANARLLAMGDIHNTDAATVFAQEEVLSRGTNSATSSGDEGFDWRGALTKK